MTAYEKAEHWTQIQLFALNIDYAAKMQNLSDLNSHFSTLGKLIKRLERSQVGKTLAKVKS